MTTDVQKDCPDWIDVNSIEEMRYFYSETQVLTVTLAKVVEEK